MLHEYKRLRDWKGERCTVTAAPDPNFAVGVLVALFIDLVYPVVHVVSAAGFVVRSLAYLFHIS